MSWYNTFDSAFWITTITILTGSLGLALKFCLKSKCDHLDICFGCIKIDRNVVLEQEEEMKAMEMGIRQNSYMEQGTPELHLPPRQKLTNVEHNENTR